MVKTLLDYLYYELILEALSSLTAVIEDITVDELETY